MKHRSGSTLARIEAGDKRACEELEGSSAARKIARLPAQAVEKPADERRRLKGAPRQVYRAERVFSTHSFGRSSFCLWPVGPPSLHRYGSPRPVGNQN